jgi:hypothetical protein
MFNKKTEPADLAKTQTVCRLCGHVFGHFPVTLPAPGQAASPSATKVIIAFGEHLATKHKGEWGLTNLMLQDVTGLFILGYFDSKDQPLNERVDAIRHALHNRTRKHRITDEGIDILLSRLDLDEEDTEIFQSIVKGIRDVYEETGAHSPEKQAENRVVLAP